MAHVGDASSTHKSELFILKLPKGALNFDRDRNGKDADCNNQDELESVTSTQIRDFNNNLMLAQESGGRNIAGDIGEDHTVFRPVPLFSNRNDWKVETFGKNSSATGELREQTHRETSFKDKFSDVQFESQRFNASDIRFFCQAKSRAAPLDRSLQSKSYNLLDSSSV